MHLMVNMLVVRVRGEQYLACFPLSEWSLTKTGELASECLAHQEWEDPDSWGTLGADELVSQVQNLNPTSGSPPPGCEDPPTRKSPGTGERLAGRRKADRAPLLAVP